MTKGQDRIGSKFEGVSGIRGMGVRDLTYKTGFLACCVQPHHARVHPQPMPYTLNPKPSRLLQFGQVNIREDSESIRAISEEEVQKMENMRRQPRLYSRLARCIAPTIYGTSYLTFSFQLFCIFLCFLDFSGILVSHPSSTKI